MTLLLGAFLLTACALALASRRVRARGGGLASASNRQRQAGDASFTEPNTWSSGDPSAATRCDGDAPMDRDSGDCSAGTDHGDGGSSDAGGGDAGGSSD